MNKIILGAAAIAPLVLGVFTAVPALAVGQDSKSATIRLTDIDLSNPADVRLLNRRVAAAKEAVCGSYANVREGEEARITACRADVDRQLEPRLAALRPKGQLASR